MKASPRAESPQGFSAYQRKRSAHWDAIATASSNRKGWSGYYHRRLVEIYRFLVPEGRKVLEFGCAEGVLLASLKPSFGVGLDFSGEMISKARALHPDLTFIQADAHDVPVDALFDYIIVSDLLNDVWDAQSVLEQIRHRCHAGTRIVINLYSRLWEIPLHAARKVGVAHPTLVQNWFTTSDVCAQLRLTDCEAIKIWQEIIFPLGVPWISPILNRGIGKLWPFRHLALTNFVVARPVGRGDDVEETHRVSVIVPARNEAGNIQDIFARAPDMGAGSELVFVEGHSDDGTYEAIEREIRRRPNRRARLYRQAGSGKGDAVRLGFEMATGDVLMILDADLTVPPEDLPRFYRALISGKGELINGVRLVYPMEDEAMRFLNLLGNKSFSLLFSWLLGQSIKDTLCGTKALYKTDYDRIASTRSYFGEFDPFGDFDLIFGAARHNLKIMDLPIRYRYRTYGATNIHRWKHGWLLLRMVAFAARRIKFI